MKTNLAVIFGCRSVEHEVAIISAVQAMRSIDREKYNVLPVYVTKENDFYTGDDLLTIENYRDIPALLKKCKKVTLLQGEKGVVLHFLGGGMFGKKADKSLEPSSGGMGIRLNTARPIFKRAK